MMMMIITGIIITIISTDIFTRLHKCVLWGCAPPLVAIPHRYLCCIAPIILHTHGFNDKMKDFRFKVANSNETS